MIDKDFKAAVGKFPTGVVVASANYDDGLYGFTANSFVSVSLSPHLISFCLSKKSRSFEAFNNTSSFAVSILSGDQEEISKHFATAITNKFDGIDYKIGSVSKSPLIMGAVCFIECKKYTQFECGDHFIFVGQVIKTEIDNSKSPLLYFAKSYQEIK